MQGVMWRQWSLCLLYILQAVVLSGMLAGYILNAPAPSSHTKQAATMFEQTSPEQGISKISQVKPSVKMKPITLSYLKEKLSRVTSRLELARLFMDSNLDDRQLSQWMPRSVRSATHSPSHRRKPHEMTRQHETMTENQGEDTGVDDYDSLKEQDKWEIDGQEDNQQNKDVLSTEDETKSIEEIEDVDYVFDYQQDEPSQDDLEAFESALHNIEEMNTCSSSKCKHPMPFVQSVRDPHDRGRVFLPECVVLHRCMNYTGCCGGGDHECVPKSMSVITKAFLIADRHSGHDDYVTFNPHMATTITFVNHTECECREKPKLLKCTKMCPKPFRLTQEGTRCRCDCFPVAFHDNWPCESVKDGVVPLSPDGQACIKSSNCYHPDCTVGGFDIKSGLCPLSDEYSLPAFLFENPDERRLYREHLRSYDFSKSKYTASDNGVTKSSTPSDNNELHRDTTDTKEQQEVNLQGTSLLDSDESSTVQPPVRDSKFASMSTTKSSLAVHDNQNIYKPSISFSFDKTKLPRTLSRKHSATSGSHSSSDKPAHELEDLEGITFENVPATNINEHNDNRTDTSDEAPVNNIASRHTNSNHGGQLNETADAIMDTSHKKSDEKMSEEATDSESTNSNSESPDFVPEKAASESSWHSKGKLDSSSDTTMNDEHYNTMNDEQTQSRESDHRTRKSARKNTFRHKFQLSSHEDFHSTGVAPQSQTLPGIPSDKNSVKNLPQPTTESSNSYSLSSSSPQMSQILSSSSRTASSYLPSPLPHQVDQRQKASKQTTSRDNEHSKTSRDNEQSKTSHDNLRSEGLFNYGYDSLDGSGEEAQ